MKNFLFVFFFSSHFLLFATNGTSWSFLDNTRIGAQQFINARPQNDGRGVVIMIIDSGVDVDVPGLQKTSTGEVKIIDVMDFSDEGRINLEDATPGRENNESFLSDGSDFKLYGYDRLQETAYDSLYYIGYFDESRLKNSDVHDLNANGRSDDRFGVILFQPSEDEWTVIVDLDGDGNLSDESPQADYNKSHRPLRFRGGNKNEKNLPLNVALKIIPDELAVVFHFDAGSHGTHVAGIAAGYNINGQRGLNGIAPGAQVISLKVGDDRLNGAATVSGSMENAFEYAAAYADTSQRAVVVNLSYGIGGEMEGKGNFEYFLNDLLDSHPRLNVCTSAGNEGPGLSSVGLPSAARRVITVGAMASPAHLRDVYGNEISGDKVLVFSSRGGEVAKPDVIAPGSAVSTVPPFESSDVMWGTSMASPQVSGAVALLLSAFKNSKRPANYLIKRALLFGAEPLKNYTFLDQGHGVVNVSRSLDLLKNNTGPAARLLDMEIETDSPLAAEGIGSAAFWRSGYFFPTQEQRQTFYIRPLLNDSMGVKQKSEFFEAFRFSTDVDWLHLVQKNAYSKGGNTMELEAYCLPKYMKKPGLYSTTVHAYQKGGLFSRRSSANEVFDIAYSVIVPWKQNDQKSQIYSLENVRLEPGDLRREFIFIPPEANALSLSIKAHNSDYAEIRAYVFNPEGKAVGDYASYDSKNSTRVVKRISGSDLFPGVWEVDYFAPLSNSAESRFNISAGYASFSVKPSTISKMRLQNGRMPTGSVDVKNNLSSLFNGVISGSVKGIVRSLELKSHEGEFEYAFTVGDNYRRVEFNVTLSKTVFNRLTDFTMQIVADDGRVLENKGLTYRRGHISFTPPASDTYYLKLIPAFARMDNQQWDAEIKASYILFKENKIQRRRIRVYPLEKKKINFSLNTDLPIPPKGYKLFGTLYISSLQSDAIRLEIPILLRATIY